MWLLVLNLVTTNFSASLRKLTQLLSATLIIIVSQGALEAILLVFTLVYHPTRTGLKILQARLYHW